MNKHPKFAVVGYPNKGKSSIVSALAMDDSVQISDMPGTTYKQRSFPLKVDGKILYELIDTPGFQRAREVLEWFQKHHVPADKKYKVVESFINKYENSERFSDEIELLKAIMAGAGIIYVVDVSKPYGQEYESQMEILRWTGQPSMALMNSIGQTDYSHEWKRALEHYFKMVRSFNPMRANLEDHISILESMAQLKEEWIKPVKASIELFRAHYKQMIENSAIVVAKLIYDALGYKERVELDYKDTITDEERKSVEEKYKIHLRQLERRSQKKIENIWHHKVLKKKQSELAFDKIDLFSQEAASVFGLTRKELLITGATSGAIAGAGIDLLFLGHTLLLGGAIGGIAGGIGAYFGFEELSDIKVLGQSMGKKMVQMGPMKNKNFPYILLGRILYYTSIISNRSHANRDIVELDSYSNHKLKWLDDDIKVSLERYHKIFRSDNEVSMERLREYENLIKGILQKLIVESSK